MCVTYNDDEHGGYNERPQQTCLHRQPAAATTSHDASRSTVNATHLAENWRTLLSKRVYCQYALADGNDSIQIRRRRQSTQWRIQKVPWVRLTPSITVKTLSIMSVDKMFHCLSEYITVIYICRTSSALYTLDPLPELCPFLKFCMDPPLNGITYTTSVPSNCILIIMF